MPTRKNVRKAPANVTANVAQQKAALEAELRTLHARLKELEGDGKSLGAEAVAQVRQVAGNLQDKFNTFLKSDLAHQYGVDEAVNRGKEKWEVLQQDIKDRPLRATLVALGVGAAVGFLLRGRD